MIPSSSSKRALGSLTLFLLFSGLLLSGFSPSHEMEELIGLDIESLSAVTNSSDNTPVYITSGSKAPTDPAGTEGDDDDCLCWCAQVLAVHCYEILTPSRRLTLIQPDGQVIGRAPVKRLFRPPRLV